MQWGESCTVLWLYRFHTPQRSCATATGEEELEEDDDDDEMRKCHGRFLCAGAFTRERTGIIVLSSEKMAPQG